MEVARFRRGSFPQPYGNSEWYDGDGAMPFVQVADVTDEMNLVGDTKQKISRKAQPLSVFAEEGSVLVTLQGSIGRVAITQYGAFIDRTVLIFEKFNLPVDNLFWAYIIKQKFIEEAKCAPGGTIKTITKEVLSDFDIKLPSHPEQETIGTFFSSLDRHITLHQRKLDKLKSVKQAYLSEMFPAEGERVPKRRFPGFTDDWEQRKLGEVIEKLKGGVSIAPNDYIEDGYRTIPKGAVNDTGVADMSACKNVSVDFFEKNYFSKTSTGELITSLRDLVPSAPNLGRIVRIVGQFEEFIMPQGVYSLKITDNLLEDFLIAYSNNYIYRSVIQSEKNGSTQVHIRNGEFLNIKIQVPSLPEQEAIGNFFSTLDRHITLHQRKS